MKKETARAAQAAENGTLLSYKTIGGAAGAAAAGDTIIQVMGDTCGLYVVAPAAQRATVAAFKADDDAGHLTACMVPLHGLTATALQLVQARRMAGALRSIADYPACSNSDPDVMGEALDAIERTAREALQGAPTPAPSMLEVLELAQATINRLSVKHGPFNSAQGTLDVISAAIKTLQGVQS